jgi:hypothetical protein
MMRVVSIGSDLVHVFFLSGLLSNSAKKNPTQGYSRLREDCR